MSYGLGSIFELIREAMRLTDRKVDILEYRIKVLEKALGIQDHYDISKQKSFNLRPSSKRPASYGSAVDEH